jgi:hypothetical protein
MSALSDFSDYIGQSSPAPDNDVGGDGGGVCTDPSTDQPNQSVDPNAGQPNQSVDPNADQPNQSDDPNAGQPNQSVDPNASQPNQSVDPNADQPNQSVDPNADQPSQSQSSDQSQPSDPSQAGDQYQQVAQPAPPVLQAITIGPPGSWITGGKQLQFEATGEFSDGSSYYITNAVTWSSSAPNLVSIDQNGLASAQLACGTATITATDTASGVSSSKEITVLEGDDQPTDQPLQPGQRDAHAENKELAAYKAGFRDGNAGAERSCYEAPLDKAYERGCQDGQSLAANPPSDDEPKDKGPSIRPLTPEEVEQQEERKKEIQERYERGEHLQEWEYEIIGINKEKATEHEMELLEREKEMEEERENL